MIDLNKRKGSKASLRKGEEVLGTPEGNMANPRTELVNIIKKELKKNDNKSKRRTKNNR